MATRNPNNTIDFGSSNFGAPLNFYTISGGTSLANETNPGEALEAIIEAIQERGTVVAVGVENSGSFRVAIERGGWDDALLTTAIQNLGAVVGTNSYNCTTVTAVTFDL